jgi:hypothetical protein
MATNEASQPPRVTSVFARGEMPDHLSEMSEDEAALAGLGYKQEFKVFGRVFQAKVESSF